jgi:hypothetical protein
VPKKTIAVPKRKKLVPKTPKLKVPKKVPKRVATDIIGGVYSRQIYKRDKQIM